jgi:hypothetical protein
MGSSADHKVDTRSILNGGLLEIEVGAVARYGLVLSHAPPLNLRFSAKSADKHWPQEMKTA